MLNILIITVLALVVIAAGVQLCRHKEREGIKDPSPEWWRKYYKENRDAAQRFKDCSHNTGVFIHLAGSGDLYVSDHLHYTGSTAGFSISNGFDGHTGGVLGLEDAKKLHKHLGEMIKKYNKPESWYTYNNWSRLPSLMPYELPHELFNIINKYDPGFVNYMKRLNHKPKL